MVRIAVQILFAMCGAFADRVAFDEDNPLMQVTGLAQALTANLAAGLSSAPDSFDPVLLGQQLEQLGEHLEHIVNEEHDHREKHGEASEVNAKLIEELAKSLESMVEVPAAEAADGERLYYQFDRAEPVRAQRTTVDKPPCEYMARFDYKLPVNNGLEVNGTHLFLPFKLLKGTFARHSHYVDSHEFGVTHWMPSEQAVSLLSDAVKFAIVEKTHTLTHTGGWATTSLEHNRETLARRYQITNAIAKKLRKRRAFLTMAAVLLFPRRTRQAMLDPLHVNHTREFVESNGRLVDGILSDMETDMASFMKQQRSVAEQSRPEPSATSYNCHHFEEGPGVQTLDTGIWVPFNQKLLSFNFQAHFTPLERIGTVVGPGVWRHHEAEHVVEYYYAGSSCFEEIWHTVAEEKPAMLYLSSPNLGDGVVGPDSREPSAKLSRLAAGLTRMANAIPVDFSWLYEDHATICPKEVFDRNDRRVATMDVIAFQTGEASMLDALLMAKYSGDAVECAGPVLSGSTSIPYSNGFTGIEALPYIHSMIEWPAAKRLGIMANPEYLDTTLT